MAHTQFLDESDFSLKIGGIEINPQTGDGIEGILKFDSWKVKKDSEDLVFYYTDVEKFRISNIDGASGGTGNFEEYTFISSNNEQTFVGTDNFGSTLLYTPEKMTVFMNGVRLSANIDFTAVTGNTVVFTDVTSNGDIVTIQSF
jgi:hypothetical protein